MLFDQIVGDLVLRISCEHEEVHEFIPPALPTPGQEGKEHF